MNFRNYFKTALVIAGTALTLSSCVNKDEWDTPPINCANKFDAANISLADFKALAPTTGYVLITDDKIFDGYVVSSDENGNFYKTISFQDKPENPTAGLQIEVDRASNYADYPVGAHIRINAKGLRLGLDRGAVKIGAVDPTYAIGRIPASLLSRYVAGVCNGNTLDIVKLVPKVLASLTEAKNPVNINTLVQVPDVHFADDVVGKKYIEYVSGTGQDTDRAILDETGGSAVIRNSGFANFGSELIPNTMGTLTFVVSRYNNNWQMLIRSLKDVDFKNPKPQYVLNEGFTNFTTNGWTAYSVAGAQVWGIATNFGNPAPSALMNGFGGVNEDWLISKPVDLSTFTDAAVSFESDGRYNGNPLELYITTDAYSGGNPSSLNWTKLDATFDTDMNAFAGFVFSGNVSLKSYVNKTVRIAFKYTNAAGAASSWEIDNVKVKGYK